VKRSLLTLTAALVLLPSAFGQATSPTGPHPLGSMITLAEQRETGQVVPLGFEQNMWKVDINSTIQITVKAPGAGGAVAPAPTPLSQTADAFRVSGESLLKTVDLSAQIQQLSARNSTLKGPALTENIQQLRDLNRQFGSIFKSATSTILTYRAQAKTTNDPDLQARAETFYARANDILIGKTGTLEQAAPNLSRLLLDEGEMIIAKLNADMARLATSGSSQALVLAASSAKDNYLALPHYSTVTPGQAVRFDKLNPLPSPEAVAELQAEFDAASGVAQLLNDIKSGKTSTHDAIKQILVSNNIDFTKAKNQIEAVRTDLGNLKLSDAETALTAIANAVAATLAANPGDKAVLEKLQADVTSLQTEIATFKKTALTLVAAIQKLDPRFVTASAEAAKDPVAALAIIVSDFNTVRNLPNAGAADLRAFSGQVTSAFATLTSIKDDLDNVKKSLASVPVATLVSDVTKALASVPAFQQLLTDVTDLKTTIENMLDTIEKIRANLGDPNVGAYNPNPPDTSIVVTLDALQNTELNLQQATPQLKEGDVVTLQAWIYSVKPDATGKPALDTEMDSAVQQFEIVRYGWFADAGAGVTYVISNATPPDSDTKTQQFAPQVAFLFHKRPWPSVSLPANRRDPWYTSWGVGIHAISLDLDRNSQLELGLGLTLSGPKGLIQIGYGRDLTVKHQYWYVGTTLFKFLSNLGIKVP
jgi:hypothetical protein